MSLCPACGRYLCDHIPDERGQTYKEMMRDLATEELEAVEEVGYDAHGYHPEKIAAARKHKHDPV